MILVAIGDEKPEAQLGNYVNADRSLLRRCVLLKPQAKTIQS
jgi:hypothetical protein